MWEHVWNLLKVGTLQTCWQVTNLPHHSVWRLEGSFARTKALRQVAGEAAAVEGQGAEEVVQPAGGQVDERGRRPQQRLPEVPQIGPGAPGRPPPLLRPAPPHDARVPVAVPPLPPQHLARPQPVAVP